MKKITVLDIKFYPAHRPLVSTEKIKAGQHTGVLL